MTKLIAPPAGAVAIASPSSSMLRTMEKLNSLERVIARRTGNEVTLALQRMSPLVIANEKNYAIAKRRIAPMPDRMTLQAEYDGIWEAIYVPALDHEVETLVGAMIDGVPNAQARVKPEIIDAISYSVAHADDDRDPSDWPCWRGFSARVLAGATRRIWSTQRFAFGAAEVIDAARAVRLNYWNALEPTRGRFWNCG